MDVEVLVKITDRGVEVKSYFQVVHMDMDISWQRRIPLTFLNAHGLQTCHRVHGLMFVSRRQMSLVETLLTLIIMQGHVQLGSVMALHILTWGIAPQAQDTEFTHEHMHVISSLTPKTMSIKNRPQKLMQICSLIEMIYAGSIPYQSVLNPCPIHATVQSKTKKC